MLRPYRVEPQISCFGVCLFRIVRARIAFSLFMNVPEKEYITHQLRLCFFDVDIHIESDSGNFVNHFAQLYRRFCRNEHSSIASSHFEFTLLSNPHNPWGKPVMICDGEIWPLGDQGSLDVCAYEAILNTIMTRVRSHLLFHAGVVSHNGKGVIIAAESMHGKTTLVLELVRRGFRFLSDEMAALGRLDHYVHPFPRCLWIRKGALELMGIQDKFASATKWFGKTILDVEEAIPGSMGTAVPVSHIIFLRNPDEEKDTDQHTSGQEVSITVDRLNDGLIAAIRHHEGVSDIRMDEYCGYPTLKFTTHRPNAVLSGVEVLCRKHKILVMDVMKGGREYPAFKTEAAIHTIPTSQAIINLLGHYLGGYVSDVLHDEFRGSSSRLFVELAAIVGKARCHRISVGPLNEVADLVCEAVNA